tara:strand:- start:209 stop:928 length:720 start_codon:yes stop_codon:yes gene_type:complete
MTNQNWVLAAQMHVPYSNPVNQIQFTGILSQTATDDNGNQTSLTAANAPVSRVFCKYTIHTSSTLSNSHAYSYIYTTNSHDYAHEWCGPNQIGTAYSSQVSTGTSNASYYTTGSYFGNGAMKNHYSYYAWGAAITDPNDPTATVQPYDRRRQGVNVGCWEWGTNGNVYPVHQHWTICCTDGTGDGSASTSNNEWGAFETGSGGNSSSYTTDSFYWYCSYNVSGTWLLYRSTNGNVQTNE